MTDDKKILLEIEIDEVLDDNGKDLYWFWHE